MDTPSSSSERASEDRFIDRMVYRSVICGSRLLRRSFQSTFLVGSRPLMYFSRLVYPSPLESFTASDGSLGSSPYFRSHQSGIPSPSLSFHGAPLYTG